MIVHKFGEGSQAVTNGRVTPPVTRTAAPLSDTNLENLEESVQKRSTK
jgi:hypothetical protein